MSDSPVLERVRALVAPIASDLQLDIYDIEQRGGVLRVTLDTRPGAESGVDLEQLALATRLISRELDHNDPVPGRYTLEVSSPGIERALRTPEHFTRAIGEQVTIRLVAPDEAGQRRFEGRLVSVDGGIATVETETGPRTIALAQVERAKTVFHWGPAPKPGKGGAKRARPAQQPDASEPADDESDESDDQFLDDEFDEDLDELDDDLDSDNETETP